MHHIAHLTVALHIRLCSCSSGAMALEEPRSSWNGPPAKRCEGLARQRTSYAKAIGHCAALLSIAIQWVSFIACRVVTVVARNSRRASSACIVPWYWQGTGSGSSCPAGQRRSCNTPSSRPALRTDGGTVQATCDGKASAAWEGSPRRIGGNCGGSVNIGLRRWHRRVHAKPRRGRDEQSDSCRPSKHKSGDGNCIENWRPIRRVPRSLAKNFQIHGDRTDSQRR